MYCTVHTYKSERKEVFHYQLTGLVWPEMSSFFSTLSHARFLDATVAGSELERIHFFQPKKSVKMKKNQVPKIGKKEKKINLGPFQF